MIYSPIGPEPERRGQTEDDKRSWDRFTLHHRHLDAELTRLWNDVTNPPPPPGQAWVGERGPEAVLSRPTPPRWTGRRVFSALLLVALAALAVAVLVGS